jgi:hypothetical protein
MTPERLAELSALEKHLDDLDNGTTKFYAIDIRELSVNSKIEDFTVFETLEQARETCKNLAKWNRRSYLIVTSSKTSAYVEKVD